MERLRLLQDVCCEGNVKVYKFNQVISSRSSSSSSFTSSSSRSLISFLHISPFLHLDSSFALTFKQIFPLAFSIAFVPSLVTSSTGKYSTLVSSLSFYGWCFAEITCRVHLQTIEILRFILFDGFSTNCTLNSFLLRIA